MRGKADPLTEELETLILSSLDDDDRVRLMRMLNHLSDWLNTAFPQALASRYPELEADAAGRKG